MDDRTSKKKQPGGIELLQKSARTVEEKESIRRASGSIDSVQPLPDPRLVKKMGCYCVGSAIGFSLAVTLFLVGAIWCATAFHGKTNIGIKNVDFQKGLSISMMVVGIVLGIFAVVCAKRYMQLSKQVNADNAIDSRRSYGAIDLNDDEHYEKTLHGYR